jgi:hypothetical protein
VGLLPLRAIRCGLLLHVGNPPPECLDVTSLASQQSSDGLSVATNQFIAGRLKLPGGPTAAAVLRKF